MWGTGASSTQCEGASPASDWWDWERAGRAPSSGDGNGFATRYAEDFALLAELGLTHHRLSIEWARLEPDEGVHDDGGGRALPRRARTPRTRRASRRGCRLHHFTLPRWFADGGGFLVEANRDRRVDAPRRVRRRDVRRPRRRLEADQRGELLRRCCTTAGSGCRRTRRPGRARPWPRSDPARQRRGGGAAAPDRCAGGVDLRAVGRVAQDDDPASAAFVDDFYGIDCGSRGSACSATGCCACPAAARSTRPDLAGVVRPDRLLLLLGDGRPRRPADAVPAGRAGVAARLRHLRRRASASCSTGCTSELPGTPLLVAEYGIGTADDDAARGVPRATGSRSCSDAIARGVDVRGLLPLDRGRQLRVAARLPSRRGVRDHRRRAHRQAERSGARRPGACGSLWAQFVTAPGTNADQTQPIHRMLRVLGCSRH